MQFRLEQDSFAVCQVVFQIYLDVYFLTMRLRSSLEGVKANTPKVDGLAGGGEECVRWGGLGASARRRVAGDWWRTIPWRSRGGWGGFPGWLIVSWLRLPDVGGLTFRGVVPGCVGYL